MFCTKCGNELKDDSKFCINCGNPVAETDKNDNEINAEAAPEIVFSEPSLTDNYESIAEQQVKIPAPPSSAVDKVKKASRSAVVLIATILYSVLVIGQLLSIFGTPSFSITDYYSLEAEMVGILSAVGTATNIFSIIGMTPMFLILIGLWINYFHSRNSSSVGTAGLTLVKSSMIVRLVCRFTVIGIVAILFLFLISATMNVASVGSSMYETDFLSVGGSVVGAYVIFGVVLLLTQVLPIMYDFFVLSAVKSMKNTLKTGSPNTRGFGGMCVMNYIFVALNALSLLSALIVGKVINSVVSLADVGDAMILNNILSSIYSVDAWAVISLIIMIIMLVLFSINLSSMRKEFTVQ